MTAVTAPHDRDSRRRVRALLEAVYGTRPDPVLHAEAPVENVFLVAAWFRRYEKERARLLQPGAALGRCSEP